MDIQKESLQTPAALFHHLHKRSLVSLASVVMPCSGLIAATEFQAWLKEKKIQPTLFLRYYVLTTGGIITLNCVLQAST